GRSASGAPDGARDALAARSRAQARREVDGPAPRGGIARSRGRPRRRGEEARGSASHGRGQQGVLALPVLTGASSPSPRRTRTTTTRRQDGNARGGHFPRAFEADDSQ